VDTRTSCGSHINGYESLRTPLRRADVSRLRVRLLS
jgi:hypothetical protein